MGVLDAQMIPVDMKELGLKGVGLHPRLQLLKPKVSIGLCLQGSIGAVPENFACPVLRLRQEVVVDSDSIPVEGETCLEIPDSTLVNKLIFHMKARHYLKTDFARLVLMLEDLASEKRIELKEFEPCKLPNIPGKGFYVHGWRFPIARCSVLEDLLVELHERGI